MNKLLKKAREDRNKRINVMIGEYIEKGYVYVSRDNMSDYILFYHHANNRLQDDIVFVQVHIKPDGTYVDNRIGVPRDALLKVAEDVRNVESNRPNTKQD